MTRQEVFNKVWDHFITNKGPASYRIDDDGHIMCRYRGPNGAKCAVGILIPDELYTADIEGVRANQPQVTRLIPGGAFDLLDVGLVQLQYAHDGAAEATKDEPEKFTEVLRARLTNYANTHGLEIPAAA